MATNNAVNTTLEDQTGTGKFVGDTSPTLITPDIGTPSSGILTNCTGLQVSGGGTGNASLLAYTLLCGGTTSLGPVQSLSSTGTSGQLLQSAGAGALPVWSTATFPTVSGTLNHMLRSDGTNWVQTAALTVDSSNNIAGAGTITASGAITSTAGIITSGATAGGLIGQFKAFCTGASLGSISLTAANNAGNFDNVLTNASTAAARTWTLPDASGTLALTSTASGVINSGTANQLAYYASSGTTLSGVGPGSSGQLFQSNGSGSAPAYTTATYPSVATTSGTVLRANGTNWLASTSTFADTYAASTLLYSNGANTVTGLATANSAVLVTSSTGVPSWSSTMTNGQLIIGSTGATPTAATLTAGTGISITNGAASITISSTAGGIDWSTISGTTQAAAVNNGYIIGNASQTTVTLPATAPIGSTVIIKGLGAAGWVMTANSGQTIQIGSSSTSTAGTLTSTNRYDTVSVTCIVANTTWSADYAWSSGLTVA